MKRTSAPLNNVLLKIFAAGFYRVHGGILFFIFLVLFGLVDPAQLLSYHRALMLAFITSPLMMCVVFAVWLLYTFKCWHYITSQIFAVNQQFLFYSSTSFNVGKQFIGWLLVQLTISLPVLAYAGFSIAVAIGYHYYLAAFFIFIYLVLLASVSAWFYIKQVNKLIEGSSQSVLLRYTKNWQKPYFSLYVYHVFDKLKLTWLITKVLSYFVITGVFLLFADVSHDLRVAGIAMLAIALSHSVMIFEERKFEEAFLVFSRNLPFSKIYFYASFLVVYFILLMPECIWLFTRFNPLMAVGLLAFALSVVLLYHSLLYRFGLDMEKYMTWVAGLFVLIFWLIMFKLLWVLIPLILLVGYGVFYLNYYKATKALTP